MTEMFKKLYVRICNIENVLFLSQYLILYTAMESSPKTNSNDQDEEWEREGLLDPAWEKQQRKVSMIKIFYSNKDENI